VGNRVRLDRACWHRGIVRNEPPPTPHCFFDLRVRDLGRRCTRDFLGGNLAAYRGTLVCRSGGERERWQLTEQRFKRAPHPKLPVSGANAQGAFIVASAWSTGARRHDGLEPGASGWWLEL